MMIPARLAAILVFAIYLLAGPLPVQGAPSFSQTGSVLVMSNANVALQYDLSSGNTAFYWQNAQIISAFYAGVGLSSGYVKGINFSNRTWSVVSSNEVSVTSHAAGLPDMIQYFTLDQSNSFLTSFSISGTNVTANWMGPVVVDGTGAVNLGITNDNRALFVPFDNDHFVTYNSESINSSGTGAEVGAFYDNVSRNGLVVGSVTHDTWKSGVYWSGANNKVNQLNVYGGYTCSWDVAPHGFVSGNVVSSPVIFVGFGPDWRTTMENFAAENTLLVPMLPWTNGVPFGWNSWGVTNYQNHLTYADAISVSDSIHTNLQPYGFTNRGTVYVNLDSYWDNLSSSQVQSFVTHCHASGQKAGVYWAPFVYWGTLAQSSNAPVPGSGFMYSDLILRTTNGAAISNDGGFALDPTHAGTLSLINYEIGLFKGYGFDYVKLDFLTHGALEGVHYNPGITTGIQAFNRGMSYLLSQINGSMFVSESIAPIFPYQYGNSRRIACDAESSEIANTAYTMNAVSCGWWLSGRLYQYNDPDILVFDNGPNTNEAQSRVINGSVTGLFLNGSILTNAASVGLAQMCLTNAAINNVARIGQTFRPVDGATGTNAAHILVRQDGPYWNLAVFNYTTGSTNETVNLGSAGLPAANYLATNLWDGTSLLVSNSFTVSLNARQAKLFRLEVTPTPVPAFSSITANGTNLIVMGTNGLTGAFYSILASTNVVLSATNWQPLATNSFDGNGNFTFTNAVSPARTQVFYRLQLQ